jgi:hypothetical protein
MEKKEGLILEWGGYKEVSTNIWTTHKNHQDKSMTCYFQDIEHYIISHIENSQSRLLICVAWSNME